MEELAAHGQSVGHFSPRSFAGCFVVDLRLNSGPSGLKPFRGMRTRQGGRIMHLADLKLCVGKAYVVLLSRTCHHIGLGMRSCPAQGFAAIRMAANMIRHPRRMKKASLA